MSQRALLVLGMHRSGTSAVTRTLNLLGADLSSRLMGSLAGVNEPGFWESKDVVEINDEILRSAGSSWDDVARVPEAWYGTEEARRYSRRVLGILRRDFAASPLFVLKDPRICRLVPFWLSVLEELGAVPAFVIPLRNPLEVAASLKSRNGFGPAQSHLLWLRYVVDAELDTRRYRRSFIRFDDLLSDWRGVASRLGEELGIKWVEAQAEIDTFLSPKHHHHHFGLRDLENRDDVPGIVKQAFSSLEAAAEGHAEGLPETMDAIGAELERAYRIFGPLIEEDRRRLSQAQEAIHSLREGRSEVMVDLGGSTDEGVAGLYREIERLGRQLIDAHGMIEQLGAKLEEQGAVVVRQGNDLVAVHEKAARVGADLEGAIGELAAKQVELEGMSSELTAKQVELERTAGELSVTREAFSELQAHASRLEGKIAWIRRIPLAGAAWRLLSRR